MGDYRGVPKGCRSKFTAQACLMASLDKEGAN